MLQMSPSGEPHQPRKESLPKLTRAKVVMQSREAEYLRKLKESVEDS